MDGDDLDRLRALGIRYAMDAAALASAVRTLEEHNAKWSAVGRVLAVARKVADGKADARALKKALAQLDRTG